MHRSGMIRRDFLAIFLAIVVLCSATVIMTLQGQSGDKPQDIPKNEQKAVKLDSGVVITDTRMGIGNKAKVGSQLSVFYVGSLTDGKQFDSNIGKTTLDITLGNGNVIRGWELGLLGIKEGGKRRLLIPHHLAWGEKGKPPSIPPKADVVFDLEVVKIVNP